VVVGEQMALVVGVALAVTGQVPVLLAVVHLLSLS
jgi:hypothetical protein